MSKQLFSLSLLFRGFLLPFLFLWGRFVLFNWYRNPSIIFISNIIFYLFLNFLFFLLQLYIFILFVFLSFLLRDNFFNLFRLCLCFWLLLFNRLWFHLLFGLLLWSLLLNICFGHILLFYRFFNDLLYWGGCLFFNWIRNEYLPLVSRFSGSGAFVFY
jgi:hypothetical protein